ncbi:MAG: glycosyltransferase family 4 protein [Rikenellaceae bacterium]
MQILFISPLPPPIHGQSLAGKMALEGLSMKNKLVVIDSAFDKGFSGNELPKIYSPKRLWQIISSLSKEFPRLWFKRYDVVYMSVGITFRGFMRYAPYMLAAMIKGEKYVLHTHGSTFKEMYDTLSPFEQKIIRFFFSRSSAVIVLGKSLVSMFEGVIPLDKVRVCENGVDDAVYISGSEKEFKLDNFGKDKVKLLFLSNLMKAKGILDLMDAFEQLPDNYLLNVAGALEPSEEINSRFTSFQEKFLHRVKYHGLVRGEKKRSLLCESDIFILPSKNEGQPLSILEAYHCACAVVTDSEIGGISDIFDDKINGVSAKNDNPRDIVNGILECTEKFSVFSENNFKKSKYYTTDKFCERLQHIFESI